MREPKLSFTLQQIYNLASSFRAEVRRILIKPKKVKHSTKIGQENLYLSNINGKDSRNCWGTLVKVNNLYYVNALLDGGAVPNIVILELFKKLGIKELLKDPGKYITANDQRCQALDITQGITIYYRENFEFSAIIYNHKAFYLWLKTKVYHKLKVLTVWNP